MTSRRRAVALSIDDLPRPPLVAHPCDAFEARRMPWSTIAPVLRERCATPGCGGRTAKPDATTPAILAPLCRACRDEHRGSAA